MSQRQKILNSEHINKQARIASMAIFLKNIMTIIKSSQMRHNLDITSSYDPELCPMIML